MIHNRAYQLTHLYAYGVRGDHGASPRGCLDTPDGIRRVLDAHHTRRVVLVEALARTQVLHTHHDVIRGGRDWTARGSKSGPRA